MFDLEMEGDAMQGMMLTNESMVPAYVTNDTDYFMDFDVRADYSTQSPPVDRDYVLNGICIPLIGMCGVLGNLLNLAILSWRYAKREIDVLERSALMGLIGLAVSDLCFCITILPHAVYHRPKTLFNTRGFHYYYRVYGIYVQNVFIKTSTCLTVVIAIARYVAICHPLRARIFVGLLGTKVAVIGTFVTWHVMCLPLLWTYDVVSIPVSNTSTLYLLDLGIMATDARVHVTFTYFWAIAGYFLPLALLTYCNINLIKALRQSRKLRETTARNAPSGRDANVRITLTLIVLILMFTVLMSPSEILHFYTELVKSDSFKAFEVAMHVTNILQALNFAFHFVLYVAVNVTFRRTIICAFYAFLRRMRIPHKQVTHFSAMTRTSMARTSLSGVSMSRNVTTNYSAKSSHETHV